MSATMTLAVILALRDQLSAGLRSAQGALDRLTESGKKLQAVGLQSMAAGAGMLFPVKSAIAAFADEEEAMLALKSTMMRADHSIAPEFEKVQRLAVELGNKLPGTTADFDAMFTEMMRNGAKAQSILDGTGKAAAYLGVALKIPYLEAGVMAQRLSIVMGIADQDLVKFMDTLQRTRNLGAGVTEMRYAFERAGGELKSLGYQGLEAADNLAPLFGMLIRRMGSGELVGTGFATFAQALRRYNDGVSKPAAAAREIIHDAGISLDFFHRVGNRDLMVAPEQMLIQLDKLNKLTPKKLSEVLYKMFGGGGPDLKLAQLMIQDGLAEYRKMVADAKVQADLQARIAMQLSGLRLLWEAATGTFTTTIAAWAGSNSALLNDMATRCNDLSVALGKLIEEHPLLAKWSGLILGGAGAALLLGGALKFLAGTALRLLAPLALLLSPLGLLAAAVAAAVAALAYFNWDAIKATAGDYWERFKAGIPGALAKARELWERFKVWSAPAIAKAGELWERFKAGIPGALAKARELWERFKVWSAPAIAKAAELWVRFKAGIPGALARAKAFWVSVKQMAHDAAPAMAGAGRGAASVGQKVGRFSLGFGAGFMEEISKSQKLAGALTRVRVAFDWAKRKLAEFGAWLSRLTGPTKEAGDAAESLGRRWGTAAAQVLAAIAALPGQIARFAKDMWNAGAALIEGLLQGVQSKWASVKATITGLGAAIKATITGALGIHSPSRVFRDYGGYLTAGLALGIRGGTGEVLREVGALSGVLGRGFAVPGRLPAVANDPRFAAGRAGGGNVIHFSPTIHVGGGTPGAVKQAVGEALQLSVREFERVAAAANHAQARRAYT